MKLWRLILTAVVVLAVAGAAVWWFFLRTTTPEDAALAVFHALASGNPDRVNSAGIDVPEAAHGAFLAAIAHVTEPEVHHVELRDEEALVTVRFRLGGTAHQSVVQLSRHGNGWLPRSSDVLGSFTPQTTPGAGIRIGEHFHPNGEPFTLLPAVYPLAAAPQAVLDGGHRAHVLPGDSFTLPITAILRPEQMSTSQRQLEDYLDLCARRAGAVPANCGIRIPWGADLAVLEEVRFRVEKYPVITLRGTEFLASEGILVATAKGIDHGGAEREFTYRTTEWSVRGHLEFSADDVALRVW